MNNVVVHISEVIENVGIVVSETNENVNVDVSEAQLTFIYPYTKRSAYVSPFHYSGLAQKGTLETADTWQIKRVEFTENGPATKISFGAWTNRENLNYE